MRSALLLATLLVARAASADDGWRVDASKVRVDLRDGGTDVSVPIVNLTGLTLAAHLEVEIVDGDNAVVSSGKSGRITLGASVQSVVVGLTPVLASLPPEQRKNLLLRRLRYSIHLENPPAGVRERVGGLVAMSEVTPDVFELRISHTGQPASGRHLRTVIQAVHPVSSHPVSGVTLSGKLTFDDGARPALTRRGVTDRRGQAVLDFDVPSTYKSGDLAIEVAGRRAGFTASVASRARVYRMSRIFLGTDKPLYQPGQALHARVLAFDSDGRALAETPGTVRVRDETSTTVFSQSVTTSRLGVASVDWTIPENAGLGTYQIEFQAAESSPTAPLETAQRFKVSRYELPEFTVQARLDQPYYLRGQDAAIDVRANYLFGKPVTSGRARVVLEAQRTWNPNDQKWEVEESKIVEGDLSRDGRFTATLPLGDAYEEKIGRWNRSTLYRDVEGTAYVTDETSGRTEERPFAVRLTREPIHTYLVVRSAEATGSDTERVTDAHVFVTTFRADGTPLECEVEIAERLDDDSTDDAREDAPLRQLLTVRTNRLGIADVHLRIPPRDEAPENVRLVLTSRDAAGHEARAEAELSAGPRLLLSARRTVLASGQPLVVDISSVSLSGDLFVNLSSNDSVLRSRIVRLVRGRATVTFPYEPSWHGPLVVSAAAAAEEEGWRNTGTTAVFYPQARDLSVALHPDRDTHRPGEAVDLEVGLAGAAGPAAGIVGLVVFDKALLERAATERYMPEEAGFLGLVHAFDHTTETFAGVSVAQLIALDRSKPVPYEIEMAARVLGAQVSTAPPSRASSANYETSAYDAFSCEFELARLDLLNGLAPHYRPVQGAPVDEAEVRRALADAGVPVWEWRDPWGSPYALHVAPDGTNMVVGLRSPGPDRRLGTADDIDITTEWPYFAAHEAAVERAASRYFERTGSFLRDTATLSSELLPGEGTPDTWRDPWGHAYRTTFETAGRCAAISFTSGGPNGVFEASGARRRDDVLVARVCTDYFAKPRQRLEDVLRRREGAAFPRDEAELEALLCEAGIDLVDWRDPWGRRYYTQVSVGAWYSTVTHIESYVDYQARQRHRRRETGATMRSVELHIRSRGPSESDRSDDFDVALVRRTFTEPSDEPNVKQAIQEPIVKVGTGALRGVVTDAQGAVLRRARVEARRAQPSESHVAITDDVGRYELRDLPADWYVVTIAAAGMRLVTIADVPVRDGQATPLDASLDVGVMSEQIEVEAASLPVQTVGCAVVGEIASRTAGTTHPAATPPLRQYFPETLYWQPALETDATGHARVRFPLADSITTWKVQAIGSTEDGKVGSADVDVTAFQPFFVDNNPPPVLTAGDEIDLDLVARNYAAKAQKVDVTLDPAGWMSARGASRQSVTVPPGDAARATFHVRAAHVTAAGPVRVSAVAAGASDAVEKRVTVHPDGEERTVVESALFDESTSIDLTVPADAVREGTRAWVQLAPDLRTHVLEAVEAVMARPHGCAEQTISSSFPSLFALRLLGTDDRTPVGVRARRYLEVGYRALLDFQNAAGGFGYWRGSTADAAVTAYALRFLVAARAYVPVDATESDQAVNRARDWLLREQRANGSWSDIDSGAADVRTVRRTALIARVLAGLPRDTSAAGTEPLRRALKRARAYLEPQVDDLDDPYSIGTYAAIALAEDDRDEVGRAAARLRALAHEESGAAFWDATDVTPFYGWGRLGRIEATALAVEALAEAGDATDRGLIVRGTTFLLHQQDRYGIWWSTQATVNVLEGIVAQLGEIRPRAAADRIEVTVNGTPAKTLDVPSGALGLLTADLTPYVTPGGNHITLRRRGGGPTASAQAIATYYTPWAIAASRRPEAPLRLALSYDSPNAPVGTWVHVRITAERTGSSGYGMMLAEIGLPPGADVDRASLDEAVAQSGWDLSRYDVLPDRVIFYVWPRAGGTTFTFRFRPRLSGDVLTAASSLYDYYNPDAHVAVAPTRFTIGASADGIPTPPAAPSSPAKASDRTPADRR
jgi:hypothetical protein